MEPAGSLPHLQNGSLKYRLIFRNMVSFYDEEFLSPRPIPQLEDQHLSAVRYH
jgi:hypothetical protein